MGFQCGISAPLYAATVWYGTMSVWNLVQKSREEKASQRVLQNRLHSLSKSEKNVLRGYITKNTKSLVLSYMDGVANGLELTRIIYRSSTLGSDSGFAYNIQPWAWEYLKKNPDLLK
jgi:hypothetical protein